jgi:hypothetical protein
MLICWLRVPKIAVAAVIVVGIDAAAMHVAARAISGGGTAETIRGHPRSCPAVAAYGAEMADTGDLHAVVRRR